MSYDNGKHVADVQKTRICPVLWEATCKCGWQGMAKTVEELQIQFSEHKHLKEWNEEAQ